MPVKDPRVVCCCGGLGSQRAALASFVTMSLPDAHQVGVGVSNPLPDPGRGAGEAELGRARPLPGSLAQATSLPQPIFFLWLPFVFKEFEFLYLEKLDSQQYSKSDAK